MSDRVTSFKQTLRAISRNVFRREKIFVFEKILDRAFKIDDKVDVEVKIVQSDDFPKIAAKLEKFRINAKERLEMGHFCVVADLHGDFVHLSWIAFNEAYHGDLERRLRISSDSVLMYGCYTVPELRGKGIVLKTWRETFNYLHERGIRKVYVCQRSINFPSGIT